jgi:3-oxoacyl-[acyl-carrier-protein] synthase II
MGMRAMSPFFVPTAMPNAASALVSIRNGYRGPSFTLASACATGCHALAMSALMLRAGDADAMVVGGGEGAITPACVAGFGNARALARSFVGADGKPDPTRASRPYDANRSGFVIGEGAGALVLEPEERARARGVPILAYLSGYGMSSDAEHIAKPHNEGRGIQLAVQRALATAGLSPSDIDYWNPHATSTIHGDVAEYVGVRAVFGDAIKRLPVSATKSAMGHLLGGAGAVETIACVCSLLSQRIHPSLNVDHLDPAFDFDLVTGSCRGARVRHVLKTSAGFGGHNVALIVSAAS